MFMYMYTNIYSIQIRKYSHTYYTYTLEENGFENFSLLWSRNTFISLEMREEI